MGHGNQDVHSTQYPEAKNVESYAKNTNYKLPYFEQEYEHAMGQSFGSFNEFWKLNRTYANVQGGFIWDFIDQALYVTDSITGRRVLRYGGDFDDRPSDYEFSGNGILFADRTEKPAMQEVKYYYGLHD